MSRISSLAINTQLINRILNTQESLVDRQTQVTTQKVSQEYSGIALDSQRLINIENTRDKLLRYNNINDQQQTRLSVAQTAVEAVRTSLTNFRKELTAYANTTPPTQLNNDAVQQSAFRGLRDLEDLLNTEVDGRFLFSGSQSRTAPIDLGVSSISGFQEVYDGARVTVPTTRDAHLEDFSFNNDENNENKLFIDDSNFLQFRRDGDGTATNGGSSTIRATSDMFSNLTAGATITIADTTDNNGTYTVESVSDDGQTVTVKTEMFTDETLDISIDTTALDINAVTFTGETTASTSGAGDITFNAANNTITSGTATFFNGFAEGEYITLSGAANAGENRTFRIASISADQQTVTIDPSPATITFADGVQTTSALAGNLTFDRDANTMTAVNAVFSGVSAGEVIEIEGTDENNGTYTVASVSADGLTVTIESTKLTDEGLTGSNFFDYHALSEVSFTAATSTIQVFQDDGTTAIPNAFQGLAVGDQITVANSVSNNSTFTIATISADGSSVTVNETVADEANVETGVTFTGSGNGYSLTTRSHFSYDAAADRITVRSAVPADLAGAFSDLTVGETITITGGSNPGTYTIATISGDGSNITVEEDITVTVADTAVAAQLEVFGTGGTISSSSYYKGDELAITHRADDNRSFEFDVKGSDPVFEKAIRAMKLVLQGVYGTEGGLDQNDERISQARYLINDALNETNDGEPPFGEELSGSIELTEQDIGQNRFLLTQINSTNLEFIGFLESSIAKVENVNELDVLTRLLDDENALNASYQTFARIRQLSLTNFL